MRRHVVFSFILVFWSLAVFTVLSAKIEEQMTAEVVTVKAEEYLLPMDVLVEDENGVHLYEVYKGDGWEQGSRVGEVDSGTFWLNEDSVGIIDEYTTYIRYASKMILPGNLVKTTPLYKGDSEEYLVIDSRKVQMLSVEEEVLPFMQKAVKVDLGLSEDSIVYNMSEIKAFPKNFPIIGAAIATLNISIMLWIVSWRKAKEVKKNAVLITVNVGICSALFLVFRKLVQKIELPDSLLPKWSIFEFGHYKSEFLEVFGALKELDLALFQEVKQIYVKNIILFLAFWGISLLIVLWAGHYEDDML